MKTDTCQAIDHNGNDIKIQIPDSESGSKTEPKSSQSSKLSKFISHYFLFGFSFWEIKWSNVFWLSFIHIAFAISYFHLFQVHVKLWSVFWTVFCSIFSGFGMSVGGHRYWSHRSFTATPLLRFFMMILQTMTVNGSILSYSRDHRNHHKWSTTHADPKNPGRGFFFAHVGWWMLKKRPEVIEYGKKVNVDDLTNDWMVTFQHRFYIPMVIFWSLLFPTVIPYLVWNETIDNSIALTFVRLVVVLHHLFVVNSVAHFWGYRPYNRSLKPAENVFINWISMGEGQHNYHHTFANDYCNSEHLWWEEFNPASVFIEVCILLRLASDPKKPSKELIMAVAENRGDHHYVSKVNNRPMSLRILWSIFDWTGGIFFAQWPLWIIMFYKIGAGHELIHL